MTEWHFPSDVHTFEFHEHRERAPHLEQDDHKERLLKTAELVRDHCEWEQLCSDIECCGMAYGLNVSDLGCGDGGLLELLEEKGITCWGYDFAPSNVAGWAERQVTATAVDVFNGNFPWNVCLGGVVVMTEVLEHLQDPHQVVGSLMDAKRDEREPTYVVASSPRFETADSHGDCHQWAWDWQGYEDLFRNAGWSVKEHVAVDWSQIIVVE